MVVAETFAGLNAVTTAFDMAKALQNIHEATARDRAVIDLQREILSAQEQQFALVQRVQELQEKVARFDAWHAQKKRYELKDYGENTFAYELKAAEANGEPMHRVCPTCYQQGHISILQFDGRSEGQDWYLCAKCKSQLKLGAYVSSPIN